MLCRLCLLPKEHSFNMFSSSYLHFFAPLIISKHFCFEPQINDEICNLCFDCWEKLKNFHEFYKKVEAAQKTFQQNLNVKKELLQEDNNLTTNNEQKTHENVGINVNPESNKTSNMSCGDLSIYNLVLESAQSELEDLCATPKKKAVKHQDADKEIPKGRKVTSDEFNKKVSDFLTFSCDLCTAVLPNFSELKLHFKTSHKVPGYVICCNKKFTQNQFLIGHIGAHMNPENYKCMKCDKILSTVKNYTKHMEKHLKEVEYLCDNCPRKFGSKSLLQRHLPIHWSKDKWKVKCTYCEKLYPTEYFMKNHVSDIHEKSKICQVCGKSFSSRKFREHQRTHEFLLAKVQCEICGAWLKSSSGLKTHMKNHQEALEVHKCNICSKISPNKGALKIHVKNHQTPKCHKCSVCKKGFKRPLALRQHMASHTGESLYKCKYCTKSFIYDSAYHTHKKREHLNEYLNERRDINRTNFSNFLHKDQEHPVKKN
ncbi:zinc finger protein draculin-like [Condylostylus longicornis]|uniref:zinc finger protein draculin-like n=1 Tax=Condylostylus longicornis TaxID=2530218 RepID=UPI00244E4C0D|nr:zinc finger protein draculin-like [Condylostylus longicornis]